METWERHTADEEVRQMALCAEEGCQQCFQDLDAGPANRVWIGIVAAKWGWTTGRKTPAVLQRQDDGWQGICVPCNVESLRTSMREAARGWVRLHNLEDHGVS